MFQEEVEIKNINGLHIRPAAKLVKFIKGFPLDVFISCKGKTVNAKSLFKLQTLPMTCGTIITVIAQGKDSKEVVMKIKKFIQEL